MMQASLLDFFKVVAAAMVCSLLMVAVLNALLGATGVDMRLKWQDVFHRSFLLSGIKKHRKQMTFLQYRMFVALHILATPFVAFPAVLFAGYGIAGKPFSDLVQAILLP